MEAIVADCSIFQKEWERGKCLFPWIWLHVLLRYLHTGTFIVVLLCLVCVCLMFGVLSL